MATEDTEDTEQYFQPLSFTAVAFSATSKSSSRTRYRDDIRRVVIEVKSVLKFEPVFISQTLTYLRITGLKRGLILNFDKPVMKAGIKRVSL